MEFICLKCIVIFFSAYHIESIKTDNPYEMSVIRLVGWMNGWFKRQIGRSEGSKNVCFSCSAIYMLVVHNCKEQFIHLL